MFRKKLTLEGTHTIRSAVMLLFTLCALGVLASTAGAAPYWITYEGNDLPENEGWNRNWGNWNGQFHGDGAIRTVEDGILTSDSLFDGGIYDFAYLEMPGQMDPGPGELFVVQWMLKVDDVVGGWYDPAVSLGSDAAGRVGFGFYRDRVESAFETGVWTSISPDVFHTYRFISWDMQSYQLYIDSELALDGTFWDGLTESYIGWGDGVQGTASRAHWDYFHFGVVPEPRCLAGLLALCLAASHARLHTLRKEH